MIISKEPFFVNDASFYKSLFLLAIPIVLQNIITFGVIFADNLMVGRLGDDAISGLYMGTLLNTVLQIVVFGMESAALILSAQYWGRHDCERIKEVVSIGMRLTLGGTALLALAVLLFPRSIIAFLTPHPGIIEAGASYLQWVGISYLFFSMSEILIVARRSGEIVRIGLINSTVAFVVNVLLNYLLIFGKCGLPALGVRGAALATVASRIIEFSIVLYFVLKVDRNLRLRLGDFLRWDREIFHDFVKYGTPVLLGQVVWAFNNVWQNWTIGHLDEAASTAASITGMFDRFLWMGTWGVAAATAILVGKAIGAEQFDRVKQMARTMQTVFFGIGLLSAVTVLCGCDIFLSFYKLSPDAIAMARQFMMVLAVIIIGRCYQAPSLYGLVKAGGDTAFVFKNDSFWVFCWVIPVSFLALHFHAAPWMVFAALLSDQITKCFVAVVKINSYNWMRNLTRK